MNSPRTTPWTSLTLRPAWVNGDWRDDEPDGLRRAPFRALVCDSLRWSGGVVPAVDRATLEMLVAEQAEMQADPKIGDDQYGLRLDGDVLVETSPKAESGPLFEEPVDTDLQRVEPVLIDGEQRWLLDLGWTFYETGAPDGDETPAPREVLVHLNVEVPGAQTAEERRDADHGRAHGRPGGHRPEPARRRDDGARRGLLVTGRSIGRSLEHQIQSAVTLTRRVQPLHVPDEAIIDALLAQSWALDLDADETAHVRSGARRALATEHLRRRRSLGVPK
jgi:hypothetical protein